MALTMNNSWRETTLGEVIEIFDQKRVPLSTQERSQRKGQYPYYGASGIIDYIDDYLFKGTYLLVSEDGENLKTRKTPIAFLADGKFWVNNHAHIIRGIPGVADDYFLMSYIQTSNILGYLTGSAQPKLSQANLKAIKLLLPPLPIQRKIAAILSAYDRLIENNTRRIEILEEMARSIYREWFVKFRFPGHEQVQMVDSELGPIPEGWEVKQLGEIAQDIRRSVKPDQIDPETPYFGLEHLPRKSIALSEWGTASQVQSTKLAFHKGEILFGKIRPYFHKVGVAPVEGVCSSDAIVIKAKTTDYFSIVLACVSSEEFVAHATQTSQGTKMPRANWDVLIKYPVAIPPLPLVCQFNEFVQNTLAQIHNLIFKNINLRQTRDLLLPRLISGEIDVENLDIKISPNAA
jgi:type I restriction enzyme S subunit